MECCEEIELGTLIYDEKIGEGRIEFCEEFDESNYVYQLDVLQDLIFELENKYKEVHKLCYPKKNGD